MKFYREYCERVTADDWYNELPTVLYKYMLKNHPDFDYKQLLDKIKLTIKNNEFKEINGSTFRGQPTSDKKLQTIKHKLVNHLPLSRNNYTIKADFERLFDKYLKEV